jgi:molybdopterin molybdotransferase
MISVAQAQAQVLALARPLPAETIALSAALGRVTAAAVLAERNHPPFAASAMDGYAVRWDDLASLPTTLTQIGVSQAGLRFAGAVQPGECVRIFTGAPLPDGADTVVVQEDTHADGASIRITGTPTKRGGHIRAAGLEAQEGETLVPAGTRLSPAHLGWLASAAVTQVAVRRAPVAELFATGDELVPPGAALGPDQIVSTNGMVLDALLRKDRAMVRGAERILADDPAVIAAALAASTADVLITIGGASVGERDYVLGCLEQLGATVAFWKIAMRPGKPLMVAQLGGRIVIGLPGNPVSAAVCAHLIVRPLLRALQGVDAPLPPVWRARWDVEVDANGNRADYMRASLIWREDGLWVRPLVPQDSSMLSRLAQAEALALRPPGAPSALVGEWSDVLPLDGAWE